MRVYVAMAERPGTRIRAAGVLLRRGDRWLLLRNAREGHWGFAKGHLDAGEGELAGALREVKEETGLVPSLDPTFRETIRYMVPATRKRPAAEKEVVHYLGSVGEKDEVRPSEEHDRFEWLTLEEALARLEHEQLRDVLRRAGRHVAAS
jgi:tRNA nucleotidyltransferase (CCA-adding enzyme)